MKLFEPISLAGITLNNRIVMAPMTRSRADATNSHGELASNYYAQRASAGLIITEGTAPAANGLGYPRIPGIYTAQQIAGWQTVTGAVHDAGGRIFVQLMHVGRVAHQANLPPGAEVLAPSNIELPGEMYTDSAGMQPHTPAREMTGPDIKQAQQEFFQAARNAIEAGFDGVELHGANGYLLEQFLHPHTNRRTDQYGGDIESRCRFLLEVVELTCAAVGRERVGIRLSPYGTFNDMPQYAETDATYHYLIDQLDELGIAYLHLCDMSGIGGPAIPDTLKMELRQRFSGSMILCGGYDKARAEAVLQAGGADLIAFGRPFISNPDFVERLKNGWPLATPEQQTFYTPGAAGYTDYPVYHSE